MTFRCGGEIFVAFVCDEDVVFDTDAADREIVKENFLVDVF
jgi:hypothetical protein